MMEQDKMELLRIGADDAEEFGVLSETIRGGDETLPPLCLHKVEFCKMDITLICVTYAKSTPFFLLKQPLITYNFTIS